VPAISTMLYPAPAYVRVEVNWADLGSATGAAVYRVDCLTGERVPLRPYVCFNGDFLTLSCGYGIFWDTEPQLDRCVYYCTQAINAAGDLVTEPVDDMIFDLFTRNVANSWGTATSGQVWTTTGPVAADFLVNGTKGFQTMSTVNVMRNAEISAGGASINAHQVQINMSQLATGASLTARMGLGSDLNNQYQARVDFTTAGNVQIGINRLLAGVGTVVTAAITVGTYVAGTQFTVTQESYAGLQRVKIWPTTSPEPADWTLTGSDTGIIVFTEGMLLSRAEVGNTNVNPIAAFDNYRAYDPCAEDQVIETCSDDLVVPSSGDFRLGDPVRPCNDVTLLFNAPIDPDCVPTQGIFFGNMAIEVAPANTGTFMPVNAKYPIAMNRQRQALTSMLTVASRTFADRDALRTLNDPGSPLLLRGPAQYGIYDRYISVGDVSEDRPVTDHRIQPRTVTLPHLEVARPSGPTQGICGAQVDDLCDIYPTWNAVAAAGLTWADLLRGKASNDTPIPDTVERTWNDVNATSANWTAVNAGNTDWDDLLDGA